MGDAFWSLSPVELHAQFKGAKQRSESWYELALLVSWHTAYWSRIKTLPSWESIKGKLDKVKAAKAKAKEPERPQSWIEMKGIMAAHRIALAAPKEKKPKPGRRK